MGKSVFGKFNVSLYVLIRKTDQPTDQMPRGQILLRRVHKNAEQSKSAFKGVNLLRRYPPTRILNPLETIQSKAKIFDIISAQ
jgi:hypothetical protein